MKHLCPIYLLNDAANAHARWFLSGFPGKWVEIPALRWIWMVFATNALGLVAASAGEPANDEIVAVYSSVSPYYARTPLPGGGFKPETYAFGDGGAETGRVDASVDRLNFMDVARAIAPHLASKGYVPCSKSKPETTDLLIMVYWGGTMGTDGTSSSPEYQLAQSMIPPPIAPVQDAPTPNNPQEGMVADPTTSGRAQAMAINSALKAEQDSAMQQSLMLAASANRIRDRKDSENAAILGYSYEMARAKTAPTLMQRWRYVIDEVEESRYYVVLMAYDFQELLKKKQKKIMWETRFSIPQRRNDFNKQLEGMIASASRFFGENSGGVKRKSMRDEHVNLGELKIIEVEPERK